MRSSHLAGPRSVPGSSCSRRPASYLTTDAHRLSTAEAADTVLVFDSGRLVERGHNTDLVAAGGVYADLHRDWEGAVTE